MFYPIAMGYFGGRGLEQRLQMCIRLRGWIYLLARVSRPAVLDFYISQCVAHRDRRSGWYNVTASRGAYSRGFAFVQLIGGLRASSLPVVETFGRLQVQIGGLWGPLGVSWAVLGPYWEHLGGSRSHLGAILEVFGAILGQVDRHTQKQSAQTKNKFAQTNIEGLGGHLELNWPAKSETCCFVR